MKPKISLITLGVTNLEKSVSFYTQLGFPLHQSSTADVAFFELTGTWLGLYPREKLAEDAMVSSVGEGFRGITLAHNVESPEKVETVLAEAEKCGATIVKPAQKVFWGGHSGYFADPDGFLWEVAYNPFIDLT